MYPAIVLNMFPFSLLPCFLPLIKKNRQISSLDFILGSGLDFTLLWYWLTETESNLRLPARLLVNDCEGVTGMKMCASEENITLGQVITDDLFLVLIEQQWLLNSINSVWVSRYVGVGLQMSYRSLVIAKFSLSLEVQI